MDSAVRSAPAGRAVGASARLLLRRGRPPGVVSMVSIASVLSTGAAATGAAATAGSGTGSALSTAGLAGSVTGTGRWLKYLWGTTTTTEVPSHGESAKVTRMP